MSNIRVVTLSNGVNVVGDVVENTSTHIKIKEPVQIISMPPRGTNDSSTIAFVPFLEYTDEFSSGIRLNQNDVMTINTPVREILNQYNKVFGSGITIASSLP